MQSVLYVTSLIVILLVVVQLIFCAIDLSKAFDKVNHTALFIKLMNCRVSVELLNILNFWLSARYRSVKWFNAWSGIFKAEVRGYVSADRYLQISAIFRGYGYGFER